MTKRITLLLATVLFAATSFAGRVEKDVVNNEATKARVSEAQKSAESAKKVEKEISKALVEKMGGSGKTETIEAGLEAVFKGEAVKKITFVSTLDALNAKGGQSADVATHVRRLLTRLGNGNLNESQKEGIIILLKNFEMAMTDMGDAAALKFERQLAFTNILSYSGNKDTRALTGDQIQELAIINSMKAELNAVLPEGQKLSEKDYLSYAELTAKQKEEAGKKLAEWKQKCG